MIDRHRTLSIRRRTVQGAGVLLAGAVLAGCAHVGQDEFETEMARVRAEMQEGDQGVENRLNQRVDAVENRMDQLATELQGLEEELDLQVERLEASLRVHTPVHFGFDDSRIQPDQVQMLARLSGVLQEHYPDAVITVEGFTDPAGSEGYNMQLGQARADAVADWLVQEGGFPADRIRSVSYGEDTSRLIIPGATGPGEEGRENRRVVIVIDHPGVGDAVNVVAQTALH